MATISTENNVKRLVDLLGEIYWDGLDRTDLRDKVADAKEVLEEISDCLEKIEKAVLDANEEIDFTLKAILSIKES